MKDKRNGLFTGEADYWLAILVNKKVLTRN